MRDIVDGLTAWRAASIALREAGVDEAAFARLASPIGLDLGARTPEETAVAIAAEIIAQAWGGSGRPLTELEIPIHHA